jgi:4-hydroxy-3-methylbut-2-en-1-yl diphosphate reductase
LVEEPLELIIVVGGFNSSNTSHLHEIGLRQGFRSYHIDSPNRIGPGNYIEHKPLEASHRGPFTVEENWLPAHPVKIGITSGASTPDRVVSEILEKVFMLHESLNAS